MAKDMTVVRVTGCDRSAASIRERHNERKNEHYSNSDIAPDRAAYNVHYKRCEGTYIEAFDKLVEAGTISTRGLRKDADMIDELVFDVNTAYFERNGGYAYAKAFYAEAYKLAVEIAGGEQYVLSAVMHADERNKALSHQLGRDVYHYHLHVAFVPVVDKEIRWTKRCKDPALVGTVKEVVKQVSHSKKWLSEKALGEDGNPIRDENGKAVLLHSYSLLQDRFHAHMRAAGYTDVERGQKGSTAQNLTALEYKTAKEKARLDELRQRIRQGETRLDALQKQLAVSQKANHDYQSIRGKVKRNKDGKALMEKDDFEVLAACAKDGVLLRGKVKDLEGQLTKSRKERDHYYSAWKKEITDSVLYKNAKARAPQQVDAMLNEVIRQSKGQPAIQRGHEI